MGRPTLLNEESQKRIAYAIQRGSTYALAAQYGGISYRALRNWIVRAEEELERRENPRVRAGTQQWEAEEPFVQFLHAIKDAEAKAAVGWLEVIDDAASNGNWQAAAWKLERRYPGDYGRRVTEISGRDGGPIETKTTVDLDYEPEPEYIAAVVRELTRALATDDGGAGGAGDSADRGEPVHPT